MSLKTLWENAQEEIEGAVGKTSYATWFSSIQASEKSPDTLVIETPDDFYKNCIIKILLRTSFVDVLDHRFKLNFLLFHIF